MKQVFRFSVSLLSRVEWSLSVSLGSSYHLALSACVPDCLRFYIVLCIYIQCPPLCLSAPDYPFLASVFGSSALWQIAEKSLFHIEVRRERQLLIISADKAVCNAMDQGSLNCIYFSRFYSLYF